MLRLVTFPVKPPHLPSEAGTTNIRPPQSATAQSRPLLFFGLLGCLTVAVAGDPLQITLDARHLGRTFEGIGALSAGASSRLLIDYPEPGRSEILDLLFKPDYGAGFQHLKVEIGGDVNSTDGCEPSHMHRRNEENYQRGYEWWLMREARMRNPDLFLDCLEWGAPAWIGEGNFFSQDNADYIAKFIEGAKKVHRLKIQYVGIWNETRADMGWIKRLRETLDRRHLWDVKIVAADDINRWTLVDVMKSDPELDRAVGVVGVHYPKSGSTSAARDCGKAIWASEDGPWNGNWSGASALAKAYNRNYIDGRMTKTIIWSPVTAYYDNLPLPGSGVMRANSPWSGHYQVQPALWATAHTTQFAKPGWKYLDSGCGNLSNGGTFVTLTPPEGGDYSVILETTDASAAQVVSFSLQGGLSTAPVHVWRSSPERLFLQIDDVTPQDGTVTLTLDPGCIYSLTTTTGQTKGGAGSPLSARFPTPYQEDFDSYPLGGTPRYFQDQAGIFEIARKSRGQGKCLRQIIDRKGIEWPFHLNPAPETFLGDPNWMDYDVSVDALIERPGFVSLFGRVGTVPQTASLPNGYWLKMDERGCWELGTATAALASGRAPGSARAWRALKLRFAGKLIQAFIDNQRVAVVADVAYVAGMVGVGSGWHPAQFDNLRIVAAPSDRNLAFAKHATASSAWDADTSPANATDGDAYTTRWSAAKGKTGGEWIEVDLGGTVTFDTVVIKPFEDRVNGFKVQYWSGSDWLDAATGGQLGALPKTLHFAAVTSDRIRLLITEARTSPSIWELEVH